MLCYAVRQKVDKVRFFFIIVVRNTPTVAMSQKVTKIEF